MYEINFENQLVTAKKYLLVEKTNHAISEVINEQLKGKDEYPKLHPEIKEESPHDEPYYDPNHESCLNQTI
jgi:hypothetical protein